MGQFTSNLFAGPNFLEGVARALDLGNTLNQYNNSPSGEMADYFALWGDWSVVGDAIRDAATQYRASTPMGSPCVEAK
jgi:hypothetical protein